MIRLWNLLVHGYSCDHRWEILSQGRIVQSDSPGEIPVGSFYNLRCTRCGDMKVRNLK